MSDFQQPSKSLQVCRRQLAEAIATGLSRAPKAEANISEFTLGDFARVMRGIATGANDYFFLTRSQADLLEIPDMFLIPAIGRTRDVPDDCLTGETFERLAISGRPTLLFSPDGRALEEFPESVQAYIRLGYTLGLPEKPLISQRRPWYRMEIRSIPPLLFAYLGRRNARFILNEVGVTPLTGFLCVYPHEPDRTHVEKLWRILNHPLTLEGLPFVGKSYGTGAIKVEPRNLEKLAISSQLVREYGLIPLPTQSQMPLL